jgi:hypothetical protein
MNEACPLSYTALARLASNIVSRYQDMKRTPYSRHTLRPKRRIPRYVPVPQTWIVMQECLKRGIPVVDMPLVHPDLRDFLGLPTLNP